jgi:hypothetical protein
MKFGTAIDNEREHVPFEANQMHRLSTQTYRQSNSMLSMSRSLSIENTDAHVERNLSDRLIDHERTLSSSLRLVGNAKTYSLVRNDARTRQLLDNAERSTVLSQRDYGDVYVRHRVG